MRYRYKIGIPVALILLLVVYGLISFLMASGVTKADRIALITDPAAYGMAFQDVEFSPRSGDTDLTLKGWFIEGEDSGRAILFVHGINSNREEDEDFLKISAELVERGFSALLFDLRAHGESDGDKVSGGLRERQDVLGAFDLLTGFGLSPDRIGVLGFSMGAATSLMTAAEEPAIIALVVDSPFADVADLIAQETARKTPFPEWFVPVFVPGMKLFASTLYDIDIDEIVPEDAAKSLDYPIMVIHGMEDTRIKTEHGIRVYDVAHPDSTLWLVPEVDHTDAFATHPDEYVERIAKYFESRLGAQ